MPIVGFNSLSNPTTRFLILKSSHPVISLDVARWRKGLRSLPREEQGRCERCTHCMLDMFSQLLWISVFMDVVILSYPWKGCYLKMDFVEKELNKIPTAERLGFSTEGSKYFRKASDLGSRVVLINVLFPWVTLTWRTLVPKWVN